MQKIVDILEQHVQWIAIGLGALFVLFMTWTYVLNPVAGVESGQEKLGPGEVDAYTVQHVGTALKSAMEDNAKLNITTPKYVQNFQQAMDWSWLKPVPLDGMFPLLKADIEVAAAPGAPGTPGTPNTPGGN